MDGQLGCKVIRIDQRRRHPSTNYPTTPLIVTSSSTHSHITPPSEDLTNFFCHPDEDNNDVLETKLKAVIETYEGQMEEMAGKVSGLEQALAESRDKAGGPPGERDKYKALARRLKEERNQYKDLVEEKKTEQTELQEEMEKMTEIIGELRENCSVLQEELLHTKQEETQRQDVAVQTGSSGLPPVRRASLTELSPRARLTPKRTISNISQSSLSSNSTSPRR